MVPYTSGTAQEQRKLGPILSAQKLFRCCICMMPKVTHILSNHVPIFFLWLRPGTVFPGRTTVNYLTSFAWSAIFIQGNLD